MADLILRSWPFIRFVAALKRMEFSESSRAFRSMSTLLPSFLPRSPITSCGVAVPAPRERLLNPLCRVTGTSMYFSSDCETESTMRCKPLHLPNQSGGKTRKELAAETPPPCQAIAVERLTVRFRRAGFARTSMSARWKTGYDANARNDRANIDPLHNPAHHDPLHQSSAITLRRKSDTPREAGGLMGWAASKA